MSANFSTPQSQMKTRASKIMNTNYFIIANTDTYYFLYSKKKNLAINCSNAGDYSLATLMAF
jgi:tRNA A37 threonylcarbamoyladenosine synthetase subunit TsaC/SUA5/YrdC